MKALAKGFWNALNERQIGLLTLLCAGWAAAVALLLMLAALLAAVGVLARAWAWMVAGF